MAIAPKAALMNALTHAIAQRQIAGKDTRAPILRKVASSDNKQETGQVPGKAAFLVNLTEALAERQRTGHISAGPIPCKDLAAQSREGMNQAKMAFQEDLKQALARRTSSPSPIIIRPASANTPVVEAPFMAQRIRKVIPPLPADSPLPSSNLQIQMEIARLRSQRKVGNMADGVGRA